MPLPTYLMSNFPSVRPSLNLQFDSQPTPEDMTSHLASVGATFSRASIGTYTDANGIIQEATAGQARPNYSSAGVHEGLLIEESRTNLIKSSQDFTANNYNNKLNIIIERHANVSTPIEGAVADKIIADTTSGGHYAGQGISVTSGTDYTHSVIVKADGESNLRFGFASAQFGSKALVIDLDDIDNPILDTVDSKTIEDLGDGWYRVSITAECTTSGTSNFAVGLGSTFSYAGNGTDGMLAVAHQVEEGSFPTSYIPTIPTFTSRASNGTYFDSSGVLQTASTDEERIDHKYIDGQWVEAGLLLEAQSENLLTYSNNPTTGWESVNVTVSNQTITNPTPDATIGRLLSSLASSEHRVRKSLSLSTDTTYTASAIVKDIDVRYFYIRDLTNNYHIVYDTTEGDFSASNAGISGVMEELGNGFWYITATFTTPSTITNNLIDFGITISSTNFSSSVPIGDGGYMGAFQLEEGSQKTSYIPTTTASATRSADVYTTATKQRSADICYIDGTAFTDFYNDDEGTVLCDFIYPTADFGYVWNINDGGSSDRFEAQTRNNDDLYVYVVTSLGSDVNTIETGFTDGQATKLIANYTSSQIRTTKDGGTVNTVSTSVPVLLFNTLNIGSRYDDTIQRQIKIGKLIYFPRALSDNELIKLTQ